jgi:hypothetical protein
MDLPRQVPPDTSPPYPYNWLSYYLLELRGGHHFDLIPYMPLLAAGWDPSPWKYDPNERPPYLPPTRKQWIRDLRRIATDLQNTPNLGIPLPDGSLQKAFTIYAWNEFGEGGYIAPTQGQQYMKLEAIRHVFGVKKR